VVLKLVEGFGKGLSSQLHSTLTGKIPKEVLDGLMQELYENNNVVDSRGGGPIFGVNGVSIIGHGSATAGTIKRAVKTARMCVETKLIQEMMTQTQMVMEIAT
jgi:glycerol-3-phosphate acyltransferase PlsX